VRVTVAAAPEDVPPVLTAVALLSPAPDLHGPTPRELEVPGLLVEGYSNQEIAQTLVVASLTVDTSRVRTASASHDPGRPAQAAALVTGPAVP
jgi:DNA-binding NarL/FixJ family response regulator